MGALIIAPAASAVGFVVMFATLGVLIIAAVAAGLATWVAKAAGPAP